MTRGHLRDYFAGVGVKRLRAVDAEPKSSNQHEIGTTSEMRSQFLHTDGKERFKTIFVWLGDDQNCVTDEGCSTHYDTRSNQPHRSPEWRLYYQANRVTELMRQGDTLLLAMTPGRILYFIVAPDGSTSQRQVSWLFGFSASDSQPTGTLFVSREVKTDEPGLNFAARMILDQLGIEFKDPIARSIDTIIDPLGETFPKTAELSKLARESLGEVRADEDPDTALVEWLDREEAVFRRFERRIVSKRLQFDQGFLLGDGEADVDGFISFSLSIQNRRKSRMGYALENHLEAVFRAHHVSYVRGFSTENKHRPDFLFPSGEAYRAAPESGDPHLTMLGAKSSCKERWRQVLAEASKIQTKHLLTLEGGISEPQTHQMRELDLQLVVPRPIQDTYTADQRRWLWTLSDFIREVKRRARL